MIRGLAIGLVLARHAFTRWVGGGGIVGVTLFFALSGYLITGLITREYDDSGRVSLRRFYRNRALRLFPPLLLMLTTLVAVELATNHLGDRRNLPTTVLVGVLYLSDLPLHSHPSPATGHLWTLSVEEQFYLVWPALLLAATVLRRRGLMICAAALTLVTACGLTELVDRHAISRIYALPSSWAVTLVIGGAGYLYRDRLRRSVLASTAAAWAALAVLAILSYPELKNNAATYLLGGPLVAVCGVVLVLRLGEWRASPRWAEPVRLLGLVSYSVYLWNFPIATWLQPPGRASLPLGQALLSAALPVIAAIISWQALEAPLLRWRRRRDARLGAPVPAITAEPLPSPAAGAPLG